MNNAYEWDIWKGVRDAVEERGGSVVCFAGAGIEDPDPEHQARSTLFDLVQPESVDAILCLSSVVGHHAGIEKMEAWLSSKKLPAFSIGPSKRVPSVSIDDTTGISQLMHHLIQHHQLRRIAFIKGTHSNTEAQRRHAAYMAALQEHGIAYEPQLVFEGDFTAESGARAIYELFDTRQVSLTSIDAVVASNDYMAFGAVDELLRRRVAVPEQVAVVGFDDIGAARLHTPELTTVRQPLAELGRRAAQQLMDQLAGKPVNGSVTLATELVLRRSCGCVPTSRLRASGDTEPPSRPGALSERKLGAALAAELHGAPGTFVDVIEPLLRQVVASGGADLHESRRFVDEFSSRVRLARQDLIYERLTRMARVLHTKMFGPQAHVSMALAQHLPRFGVEECAVSELLPELPATSSLRKLKLAFGFDGNSLQPQMVTFDGRLLVPDHFVNLRSRSVFVMPLTCGPQPLGIAVLPAIVNDGSFYETLAELFATILKVFEVRRSKA